SPMPFSNCLASMKGNILHGLLYLVLPLVILIFLFKKFPCGLVIPLTVTAIKRCDIFNGSFNRTTWHGIVHNGAGKNIARRGVFHYAIPRCIATAHRMHSVWILPFRATETHTCET